MSIVPARFDEAYEVLRLLNASDRLWRCTVMHTGKWLRLQRRVVDVSFAIPLDGLIELERQLQRWYPSLVCERATQPTEPTPPC